MPKQKHALYVTDTMRCYRMRAYKTLGTEKSDPADPADYMPRLRLDQTVRDRIISHMAEENLRIIQAVPVARDWLKGVAHAIVDDGRQPTLIHIDITHRLAKAAQPRKRAAVGMLAVLAKIDRAILAEVSRDDFSVRETEIGSGDIRAGLEDWAEYARRLQTGDLPHEPLEKWECRFCPWRTKCTRDKEGAGPMGLEDVLSEEPVPFALAG